MITWREETPDNTDAYPVWHGEDADGNHLVSVSQDQTTGRYVASADGELIASSSESHVTRLLAEKQLDPCVCVTEALQFGREEPLPCRQCGRGQQRNEEEMAKAKKTEAKPDNGDSKNTRTVQSTRSLRCPLTSEEILERADRAAHLLVDIDAKEADLDSAKKQAKADIERLEAEHRALSGQIRDRAEYRNVVCDELHDYRTWKVTITRRDTGEVVDERAMTLAERESAQEALPLESDEAKDAVDALCQTLEEAGATMSVTTGDEQPKGRRGRKPKGEEAR